MVEPRGQVGTFAGRQLHWREQDGDGPAVVLMAGCGLAMEFWRDLVQLLPDVRVLAYDRPGMGGTRWPGHLPRLSEEVASLAALLDERGISGAVLVAHSMASFHAEALARQRPDLVSGVVMVDGSVEWYTSPPPTATPGVSRKLSQAVPGKVLGAVRGLNVGRLAGLGFRFGTYLQSTWDFSRLGYGRLPAIYRDADTLAMATAESLAYERQGWDLLQLRRTAPWPSVGVVLLSAGTTASWLRTQARYARLLGGRQVVVEDSKHLMMLDCPQVIADAVRELRGRGGQQGAASMGAPDEGVQ